jgi:spore coat-associated protein N
VFRRALAWFICAGVLSTLGIIVGASVFTSTFNLGGNAFTSGTVVLQTNPATSLVTLGNMAPGDQVTAPLTIDNSGSLDLRYAMTTASTDTDGKHLSQQLALTVKSGVLDCSNGGFGGSGQVIYAGPLSNGSFGNPAQGYQPGDRVLNAGAHETLCFHVLLPLSTGNPFQGAATVATFAFTAEQTANNP